MLCLFGFFCTGVDGDREMNLHTTLHGPRLKPSEITDVLRSCRSTFPVRASRSQHQAVAAVGDGKAHPLVATPVTLRPSSTAQGLSWKKISGACAVGRALAGNSQRVTRGRGQEVSLTVSKAGSAHPAIRGEALTGKISSNGRTRFFLSAYACICVHRAIVSGQIRSVRRGR